MLTAKFKQILISHTRIGYGYFLIVIDIFVFLWISYECINFYNLGYDFQTVLSKVWIANDLFYKILDLLVFLALFLLVIPNFISFFSIIIFSKEATIQSRIRIFLIHIIFLTFFSIYFFLSPSMQLVSGYAIHSSTIGFAFTSKFLYYVNISLIPAVILTVILISSTVFLRYFLDNKMPLRLVGYFEKMRLRDFSGEFYPTESPTVNMNCGALAPEIPFIKNFCEEKRKPFRDLSHNRLNNDEDINKILITNETLLIKFIDPQPKADLVIEFFSSTSRALEVAISQTKVKNIIVSPYEHKVELEVIEWIKHIHDKTIYQINFSQLEFNELFGIQKNKIIKTITEFYEENPEPFIFLISEVWSAAGWHLPVKEFIEELSDHIDRKDIIFIVDGAHAFGNVNINLDYSFNYYITSAHKWLLSPEPGGILLRYVTEATPTSYDTLRRQAISKSTMSVNQIIGLNAGLETIKVLSFAKMKERSTYFKNLLIEKLSTYYEVFDDNNLTSNSAVFSIFPRTGYSWIEPYSVQGLEQVLKSKGLIAVPFTLKDNLSPFVRLTIPYFVRQRDIHKCAEILESVIRPAKTN